MKTWILIADGARARILEAERHGKKLQMGSKHDLSGDHRPSRELLRDGPYRVFESTGTARHAIERKSDPHRELKRHFAGEIAAILAEALETKDFDRLVVVAPAVMMGDLRHALSKKVKAAVVGEAVMDLTKVPDNEISSHIHELVPL